MDQLNSGTLNTDSLDVDKTIATQEALQRGVKLARSRSFPESEQDFEDATRTFESLPTGLQENMQSKPLLLDFLDPNPKSTISSANDKLNIENRQNQLHLTQVTEEHSKIASDEEKISDVMNREIDFGDNADILMNKDADIFEVISNRSRKIMRERLMIND